MRIVVAMVLFIVLGLTIPASSQQGGANSSHAESRCIAAVIGDACFPKQFQPASYAIDHGAVAGGPSHHFDAGPFGRLSLNGVLSGFGLTQTNHVAGDSTGQAALSDAQVFIQKADGPWQFSTTTALQHPLLGTPYTPTGKQVSNLYGPVQVAYLKLVPNKSTSIEIGELPTLMGAEYTFDFENMNIERGLLWNRRTRSTAVFRLIRLWESSLPH